MATTSQRGRRRHTWLASSNIPFETTTNLKHECRYSSTYLAGCEVFEIDSDSNRKINYLWTNAEKTFIYMWILRISQLACFSSSSSRIVKLTFTHIFYLHTQKERKEDKIINIFSYGHKRTNEWQNRFDYTQIQRLVNIEIDRGRETWIFCTRKKNIIDICITYQKSNRVGGKG